MLMTGSKYRGAKGEKWTSVVLFCVLCRALQFFVPRLHSIVAFGQVLNPLVHFFLESKY